MIIEFSLVVLPVQTGLTGESLKERFAAACLTRTIHPRVALVNIQRFPTLAEEVTFPNVAASYPVGDSR